MLYQYTFYQLLLCRHRKGCAVYWHQMSLINCKGVLFLGQPSWTYWGKTQRSVFADKIEWQNIVSLDNTLLILPLARRDRKLSKTFILTRCVGYEWAKTQGLARKNKGIGIDNRIVAQSVSITATLNKFLMIVFWFPLSLYWISLIILLLHLRKSSITD